MFYVVSIFTCSQSERLLFCLVVCLLSSPKCVYVCCAGESLKVSMLIKAQSSAAGDRESEVLPALRGLLTSMHSLLKSLYSKLKQFIICTVFFAI